jgi:hypothetical protein
LKAHFNIHVLNTARLCGEWQLVLEKYSVSEYFYVRITKLGAESQNIQGINQGLPTTMSQANAWRRITI